MQLKKYLALLATILLAGASASADVVDDSFYPYSGGVPSVDGLAPGTVVTPANVEQFAEYLDPALYTQVKDGWVEITVGETTSFDLHPNYIKATRDGLGKVSLGSEVGAIERFCCRSSISPGAGCGGSTRG